MHISLSVEVATSTNLQLRRSHIAADLRAAHAIHGAGITVASVYCEDRRAEVG